MIQIATLHSAIKESQVSKSDLVEFLEEVVEFTSEIEVKNSFKTLISAINGNVSDPDILIDGDIVQREVDSQLEINRGINNLNKELDRSVRNFNEWAKLELKYTRIQIFFIKVRALDYY